MYKFNKTKHIHTFNDKPLHGVTTVLEVIAKPALIQWSADMACDYINSRVTELFNNPSLYKEIIEEARFAHRKKKEKAGDWGTIVHEAIERHLKGGPVGDLDQEQQNALDLFIEWERDNKVKVLESEKHLYSEKLWIGGIVDMTLEMDGKRYVADIKTSKNVYPEMFAQMGAYDLMLQDMGEEPYDGYLIIHLPQKGGIEIILSEHMEINRKYFLAALELYKIKQKVDDSIN